MNLLTVNDGYCKISPSDKMRIETKFVYDTEESFQNFLINILNIHCNTADWFDFCCFLQLYKQKRIRKRGH